MPPAAHGSFSLFFFSTGPTQRSSSRLFFPLPCRLVQCHQSSHFLGLLSCPQEWSSIHHRPTVLSVSDFRCGPWFCALTCAEQKNLFLHPRHELARIWALFSRHPSGARNCLTELVPRSPLVHLQIATSLRKDFSSRSPPPNTPLSSSSRDSEFSVDTHSLHPLLDGLFLLGSHVLFFLKESSISRIPRLMTFLSPAFACFRITVPFPQRSFHGTYVVTVLSCLTVSSRFSP